MSGNLDQGSVGAISDSGKAEVTELSAVSLSQAIQGRQISCHEVLAGYLARISRINPRANAIVNLRSEKDLLAEADQMDALLAQGQSLGWMHGLPVAPKDTTNAAGLPTTRGCVILKDEIAQRDAILVARMKAAGAVIIGKTNVPELSLGSHTFNPLFGITRNAYDPDVSAGGSSGGAAVALAHRMLPIADGTDLMGSLRNPAAWSNIFGLRPSQGRVPLDPGPDVWLDQLAVGGPMARTTEDLARLLGTIAGGHHSQPLSLPDDAIVLGNATGDMSGRRIGWLADLEGYLATDAGILTSCQTALTRMEAAGAIVEPIRLNTPLEEVWKAWQILQRALIAPWIQFVLDRPGARDEMRSDALRANASCAPLSFDEFSWASRLRTTLYQDVLAQLRNFDCLALPAAQVWPFPVDIQWPREIAGRSMDAYNRWMECAIYATLCGLPAISVPAGFDPSGRWPAGLQLIGQPRGEMDLIELAAHYEILIHDWTSKRPDFQQTVSH